MIGAAYDLPLQLISGGPVWVESDPYDIDAVTPGEARPTNDAQMSMLRNLLADRFKLALHRDRKDLPLYELTVARSGAKLQQSTTPPEDPPVLVNRVFPNRIELPARNASMQQFASMLQRAVLDRPVVDKKGITAKYDFDLEWTPDDTQLNGAFPPISPDAPRKPDLFAALQQQLGLRLQASRGPVEVIVIDRVDRPSDN
jgi:uncharacterized protein (TIGR03435 family)